jgi:hypothetical protein
VSASIPFARELVAHQLGSRGHGVALGEDQIDHRQHALDALVEHVRRRRLVRNAGVADLLLGPHQALRHGLLADQERASHGLGGEAADRAQRQRDARLDVERRVAAGEDQPQHVVAERIGVLVGRCDLLRDRGLGLEVALLRAEQDLPAQTVDRLVPSDIDQPGARISRNAFRRPLLDRRREGFLQRLLGELEIADEADQRREDATRLLPEDPLDILRVVASVCRHPKTMTGRTSMEPNLAEGTRAAIAIASSRFFASIR